MPELPEVETARSAIERAGLGRVIADVDDSDRYECRPHPEDEIKDALIGRRLTGAFRRGKSMWCTTSGVGRARTPGPHLGLHLGMSGHILITDQDTTIEGGDWLNGRYERALATGKDLSIWDRFTMTFADGGTMRLFDPRRLGRVRLDPDIDALGPDAAELALEEFEAKLHASRAPVKARLLDQSTIAGIGNLLADQILWQAKISPQRPCDQLNSAELKTLHESILDAVASAISNGGSHTGALIGLRKAGRHCPRCGAELTRATVGGRTTWWCPTEQT